MNMFRFFFNTSRDKFNFFEYEDDDEELNDLVYEQSYEENRPNKKAIFQIKDI